MGFCLDNLNEDRDKAFKIAVDKGFYQQPINRESELFMIVTELSEAINALRNNRHTELSGWTTSDYSYDDDFMQHFEKYCKDTFEDELADTLLRALSLAGALDIDLKYAENVSIGRIPIHIPTNPPAAYFWKLTMLFAQDYTMTDVDISLNRFIGYLLLWCRGVGIEIGLHVYLKMIYNEHRPYLNGKSF